MCWGAGCLTLREDGEHMGNGYLSGEARKVLLGDDNTKADQNNTNELTLIRLIQTNVTHCA